MSERKSHWVDDEFWQGWRDHPAVAQFEDLSPRRQLNVLWSQTKYDGYFPDFQELMGCARTCNFKGDSGLHPVEAVLGDDGRYHATRNGELVCGSRFVGSDGLLARPDGRHDMWFSEKGRSSHHGPTSLSGEERVEAVTWTVQLIGEPIEPHKVLARDRCPRHASWPPPTVGVRPSTWTRLVEELGPWCGTCDQRANTVDHDHLTGVVRGLLCRDCNTRVDRCAHPSGCHFADYLNSPPAPHLEMDYPRHLRSMQRPRRVERMDRLIDAIATEERLAHLRDFVVDGQLQIPGP